MCQALIQNKDALNFTSAIIRLAQYEFFYLKFKSPN